VKVWVVVDRPYDQCDEDECDCSGLVDEVFASEQTAEQYAIAIGCRPEFVHLHVREMEVLTKLPAWVKSR
jgi:hypothetical protein